MCVAAVVRQGEIVEQGSHGELIQIPNGAYATLVRLQASAQHPALQQKQQPISQQLQHSADPEVLQKVISSQVCRLLSGSPTCSFTKTIPNLFKRCLTLPDVGVKIQERKCAVYGL